MKAVFIISLVFIILAQDATHYVTTTGFDTFTCGAENSPCAGINQVISNNPGASYTVSISSGSYTTHEIYLLQSAFVIFQGCGNPAIHANWNSDTFISNTYTSGFEFHDLSLSVASSHAIFFSKLNGFGNTVGFYNICLTYVEFAHQVFIEIDGGSLTFNNLTFDSAVIGADFIHDISDGGNSNISIIGSTFTHINLLNWDNFFVFNAHGAANITLDSNSFYDINTLYGFIVFVLQDSNQEVNITNNLFNFTRSYLPCIYIAIANNLQCTTIIVQNTTWNDSHASTVSGALGIIGSHDHQDHKLILDSLKFDNCYGNFSGALYVAFITLNLSHSTFGNNSAAEHGSDIVQGLDFETAMYSYSITDSYSSSIRPRAVVWNQSNNFITDISDKLPDSAQNFLTRRDVSDLSNIVALDEEKKIEVNED